MNWTTWGETANDHFEIQRSGSNTDFKTIGSVKGKGITSKINNYSFTDVAPEDGYNYYRLIQVDAERNVTYSSTILVRFNFKKIAIYPNPAHDRIFITNNNNFSNRKNVTVELMDYSGKVISKQKMKTNDVNIMTFNIPERIINGMYILVVENSYGEKQVQKIFINR